MFDIPLTAAAEKKSYLTGMVNQREKHTNDYAGFLYRKKKRLMMLFLFVDDIFFED